MLYRKKQNTKDVNRERKTETIFVHEEFGYIIDKAGTVVKIAQREI